MNPLIIKALKIKICMISPNINPPALFCRDYPELRALIARYSFCNGSVGHRLKHVIYNKTNKI